MLEITGDPFEMYSLDPESWLVLPTSSNVTLDGDLVVSGNLVRQLGDNWPEVTRELGTHLLAKRGRPFAVVDRHVIVWPIRPKWHYANTGDHQGWMCLTRMNGEGCGSQLGWMIRHGIEEVTQIVEELGIEKLYCPKLGGGAVNWEGVRRELSSSFDERLIVVH